MKPKVTASPRGGVGSNRRRTGSLQENEPDSASVRRRACDGWRSLGLARGPIERAAVTVKATLETMTWLGAGCPEGKAE